MHWADRLPGCWLFPGPIPAWWALVFALGLLVAMLVPVSWPWRGLKWLAGLGWLVGTLWMQFPDRTAGEFRLTFLSVGHGGCAVLEMPDGQTVVYDAGSTDGPSVVPRRVVPFLWQRRAGRVEVVLSHADLDHFNGLPALADRFRVQKVITTDTFSQKESTGVALVLADIERRAIPVETARAGDRWEFGNVSVEVLHPPTESVVGNENARSLVLKVHHHGYTILLTGDLEKAGLDRVLRLPSGGVDVLMAPHHGSRGANKSELAEWALPRLVVSSQSPRDPPPASAYTDREIPVLTTAEHGAITLRSNSAGLTVETFRTGRRWVVRAP